MLKYSVIENVSSTAHMSLQRRHPERRSTMFTVRKAEARGRADFGWLDSRHSFSFGHYHDPAQMGFGPLRVINDDRVAPGAGFPTHPHSDMEIISYVLDGALAHKDSLGTGSVIRPGDVQRMSAGTGIRHSEFNASKTEPVHFLQIWIVPERKGLKPSYEQKTFPAQDKRGRLRLVGSRDGREGSVTIHRDVDLYAALLKEGDAAVSHRISNGRAGWVQVAQGTVTVNGEELRAGDGLAVEEPGELELIGTSREADVLLFDLAL
jgi:redox-sensitive bicupin YhaK (pirin superfamily)